MDLRMLAEMLTVCYEMRVAVRCFVKTQIQPKVVWKILKEIECSYSFRKEPIVNRNKQNH